MNPEQDLKEIFRQAVKAVAPYDLIKSCVKREGNLLCIECEEMRIREDLSKYREVVILGVGKASCGMAKAMENILGETISRGVVVTKYGQTQNLEWIQVMEAGHPIPDENSLAGAHALARLASDSAGDTLIINLISGGGSSLICMPAKGITLADKQETTRLLLESGAAISEINCVRKHISEVKGGNLARLAYPARVINLILSDVMGDRLDTIASGIMAPDPTTFQQTMDTLRKYHIEERAPESVKQTIESGIKGSIAETPKPGDPVFDNVSNVIMGNNNAACRAAKAYGKGLGYNTTILTISLSGEARQIAHFFSSLARDIDLGRSDLRKPALIVTGGETTVSIRGTGKGGRNQEMALAFLCNLMDEGTDPGNIFFLSAGTDGIDGPTDAAGAIITPAVSGTVRELRIDPYGYLEENDSYHFFEKTGYLFKTGATNTNVCDIQLLIVL